jgi:integrase
LGLPIIMAKQLPVRARESAKKSIPIAQLFEEYVAWKNSKSGFAESTRKETRPRLFGKHYGKTALQFIEEAGATQTNEITLEVTDRLDDILWERIKALTSRNGMMTAIRQAFIYGIEHGYLWINSTDIKLKQRLYTVPKPKQPSQEQRKIISTCQLAKNEFRHLRRKLLFDFMFLYNGARPSGEAARLNVDDVKDLEITLARKRDHNQTISFLKEDAPTWERYKMLREKVIEAFPHCNAKGSDAMFIKLAPTMGRKMDSPDWRMDSSAIMREFRALKKTFPELQGLRPYDLRRGAITNQHEGARTAGVPREDIDHRSDQSATTSNRYYKDIQRELCEIFIRTPERRVTFGEAMFTQSLCRFLSSPKEIRHLGSAFQWFNIVGQTQLHLDLRIYRDGKDPSYISKEVIDSGRKIMSMVKEKKINFSENIWQLLYNIISQYSSGEERKAA